MDLDTLRGQIDAVDDQLLELFIQRMEIVKRVAEYKIKNGLPVLHAVREEEILARIAKKAGAAMAPYAADFYRALMAVSRSMQQTMTGADTKRDA